MQSLYNIAGFLGAQSRSNPSDHGDSWNTHKAIQPKLQPQNATSRQECVAALDLLTQLNRKYIEITREPELIPINPSTINVGDTVKFIETPDNRGNFVWHWDLTVSSHYEVVKVDRDDTRMSIMVEDDSGDNIWVLSQYFMQVV